MRLGGSCYILCAFDIGLQIDLEVCSDLLPGRRFSIKPRYPAPQHFEFKAKPVAISRRIDPLAIGAFTTADTLDMVLFDFGAVSVSYRIPFHASLEELAQLSDAIYDHTQLRQESMQRVEELLESIRTAVAKPEISSILEDYVIVDVVKEPGDPEPPELLSNGGAAIAQILRCDTLPVAKQEMEDALSDQISYTPSDVALVNWNTAFLYSDDSQDARAVLDFANVQLLEMRFLDRQLDRALESSYELLTRRRGPLSYLLRAFSYDLKRVSRMQVDGALLFEGVSNALKMLGDQYLARIYRTAARRYCLGDWDRSISRKLHALESIYEKLEDQAVNTRMQLMELTIVLLIVFEIVVAL